MSSGVEVKSSHRYGLNARGEITDLGKYILDDGFRDAMVGQI